MKLADIILIDSIKGIGRSITAKRRRPLVYDPDHAIKEHVNSAAGKMSNHWSSESESNKPVRKSLETLMNDARLLGYEDGAHYSGKQLSASYIKKVAREARDQAKVEARGIGKTTRKGLDSESPYITSSDRAMTIASHVGRKAYNQGMVEAFGGHGFGKSWISNEDSCDICTTNEDDDIIDMNDVFSSGDSTAPAHPNCSCTLGIHL